jgi:hypothetical protein
MSYFRYLSFSLTARVITHNGGDDYVPIFLSF